MTPDGNTTNCSSELQRSQRWGQGHGDAAGGHGAQGHRGQQAELRPPYPAAAGRPTEEPVEVLAETARSGRGRAHRGARLPAGVPEAGPLTQKARCQPAREVPARRAPPYSSEAADSSPSEPPGKGKIWQQRSRSTLPAPLLILDTTESQTCHYKEGLTTLW